MNNPFSYIFVPPVLAPTVLPLPLNTPGLHTLALEQQQQQNLIQSPLVATGLYNSLASDQSVAATNSALVKKAKTQHTIVGKPVMYGNKSSEKKPETQVNDGTTAETTSDYASDEHASDVNSESGTLASTDSGRPDSARNGASSLSPRTVESNTNKQNSKKINISPVQTPSTGNGNRNDQSGSNATRNPAKLIYHRKPEGLSSVGNGNQNKSETRKGSDDDGTSSSSKTDGGSTQRLKRLASDDNSNPVHSDASSPAKRVKIGAEEKSSNGHVSLVSYKVEETPLKTSSSSSTTAVTATASLAKSSSSVSLSTAAAATASTAAPAASLAADDDMDLDDDGPESLPAPPPPPPSEPEPHQSPPVSRNSQALASLTSGGVHSTAQSSPGEAALVSSLAAHQHPALSFDGAVTTWVSAPTVNSVASANHFVLPSAVASSPIAANAGLPASYIHPYAAAVAAATNQTFASPQLAAHYQMPAAAAAGAHPLAAHLNFAAAAQAASPAAAYMQTGTPAAALSSLPLALRLQNMASLQHAAALQQAASSYQLQMQAAASHIYAPQHAAAAAAQNHLLNQQAAAAAAFIPQQQVLSIAEEMDPLRVYLQKR